jgi:hypothetical protein
VDGARNCARRVFTKEDLIEAPDIGLVVTI